MKIGQIQQTISRENKEFNKPTTIKQLRSALFDQSWVKNVLYTILSFGDHYFFTLTNEAKQLYKETREGQKVDQFTKLAARITEITSNSQSDKIKIDPILDTLKSEGYSNNYNDKILRAAIIAISANRDLNMDVGPGDWKALKALIIDTDTTSTIKEFSNESKTKFNSLEEFATRKIETFHEFTKAITTAKLLAEQTLPPQFQTPPERLKFIQKTIETDSRFSGLYTQEEIIHFAEAAVR